MTNAKRTLTTLIIGLAMAAAARAEDRKLDYQVLSTSRISTMEKELNQVAASGYRFVKVTSTPNIFGGKELVVVTVRDLDNAASDSRHYKILSAGRSSSLQKKVQAAAKEGYEYLEQTTMPNVFGGTDLVVILEKK